MGRKFYTQKNRVSPLRKAYFPISLQRECHAQIKKWTFRIQLSNLIFPLFK
jgi:aromatic ring-cleaving dioxygenase